MTSPASEGASVLSDAHQRPWVVADRWREHGGRVVGLVGRYAPRELVVAAAMLPIRLAPDRLVRTGETDRHVLAGLHGELPEDQLAVISALLGGQLDWVDALLVGRDSEAHTKLFYLLREMASDPEFRPSTLPFAFSDVLRLPARTSAVYNRRRMRELQQLVARWAQREPTVDDLRAAIDTEVQIGRQLDELDRLRADNRLEGSEVLLARSGAAILPASEATAALAQLLAACESRPPEARRPRVLVTGSEPSVELYRALEAAGLALVGDDQRDEPPGPDWKRCADPIDWLADRYQYSVVGAARAGLDRVSVIAERARTVGADAVVQLLVPDDEASEWELAELEALLVGTPVIAARLDPASGAERLASELADRLATGQTATAQTGGSSHH